MACNAAWAEARASAPGGGAQLRTPSGCGKATYESITGGDGSNPARPTASTAGITRGITTYSAGIRRHVHNLDRQFRLKESATVQGHARH